MLIALLALIVLLGWPVVQGHQRLMSQTFKEQIFNDETALRLPHVLARIQRDLYKLTIWAQIDVEGPEVTSTLHAIDDDLDETRRMLSRLAGQPMAGRLEKAIQRYGLAVEQALILINRSPRLGATATRGMESVYREADQEANNLAKAVKERFDQKLSASHASWKQLVDNILTMIGVVGVIVLLLAVATANMIAKPIKNLASVVDQFRHGKLEVQVPWTMRKDEIGLVARAIESFRVNLIRNQILEREREQLNQELEQKVDERTHQLAEQTKRLEQALEKEHELNGLQRQFVSMVCHEFRTPLAIIDGHAQRLIKRHATLAPDRIEAALGTVRTSVRRLTDLMESVLSASRLEAGAIEMTPAPCDLAEMIDEVVSNYREVNPTYRITADVDALPEQVTLDVKLMRQVVSNLLSNAVKYSPDAAHVRIEAASCDDGGVKIAVHDQGVGIPEGEVEKLFDRFFRASTSTGIAGTGIGLHMVKALVDLHGGRVDIKSEVDVGTTFTVYLPRLGDLDAPDHGEVVTAA